ncbi:MAG: hypothetical protein M1817_000618 [Caeruleum heppii]|nr:MAG: hypothetical protein M1817_000618 [Caeruleum heppii]
MVGPTLGEYVHAGKQDQTTNIPDWAVQPEIPSAQELLGLSRVVNGPGPHNSSHIRPTELELPINKIKGSWKSKDEYLGAHYELLREDAVAPLRDAIEQVADQPTMGDTRAICIYEKVRFLGYTLCHQGPAARVAFSIRRAGKKIRWEQSKRLIPGTLVALTTPGDMFKTICKPAIVAARPLEGVNKNPPQLDLLFANPSDIEIDPQPEWIMTESRDGYYEALRHTLTSLQKLRIESFPLAEHLVSTKKRVESPAYLEQNPFLDLSRAFPEQSKSTNMENVNVLQNFPSKPTSELDETQLDALQRMLTRRLAIVQGPPGTGKTYVSVIALKILLGQSAHADRPIIIASQTNHALDQLLRHVAAFETNFVRIGGRTLDQDVIKERTLFELRQKRHAQPPANSLYIPAKNKIRLSTANMTSILKPLHGADGPMSAAFFRKQGLLTDAQYSSLEQGAKNWVSAYEEPGLSDCMAKWLGDELYQVETRCQPEEFGFDYEEIDLEFEQLKELEAEVKGSSDDERVDALSGKWIPLTEPFTTMEYPSIKKHHIKKALDVDDLWDLPSEMRSAIYGFLRAQAKAKIREAFQDEARSYMSSAQDLRTGKWELDYEILRKAKVIGMTTTGLSKYRPLVASLMPRVLVVEEAAETIEGLIAAGCVESLQHLIMVGDHRQLRGHCSVHELEGPPFNLGVSMFERLINNGIEYTTLKTQLRMIPEIRRVLTPIYDKLDDHPSVLARLPVPGMGGVNSFFMSHRGPESFDHLSSKCNETEALHVVGLFNYLILNGMTARDITVLTFYNGQRKRILSLLRQHANLQGLTFNVKTVDSYQGEENGVVLLSLVRSNHRREIGFLSIENRVCVALSRAQRGFYVFGNADTLCRTSLLWYKVVKIMSDEPRRVGFALPLACSTHERVTWVRGVEGWALTDGGCQVHEQHAAQIKAWNAWADTAGTEERRQAEDRATRVTDGDGDREGSGEGGNESALAEQAVVATIATRAVPGREGMKRYEEIYRPQIDTVHLEHVAFIKTTQPSLLDLD